MGTGAPHWPRWPRHRWAQHTFKSASAAMSVGPRRASIRPLCLSRFASLPALIGLVNSMKRGENVAGADVSR